MTGCSAVVSLSVPDADETSHVLTLSDGCAWNLKAANGARSWLQEFARILRLPAGLQQGNPNIHLVRGAEGADWFGDPAGSPDLHLLREPHHDRWLMRDLTIMRLWHAPHGPDRICELLNTRKRTIELLMMWQALHPIFDTCMHNGGLPLHAALVTHNGRGVLLAGTGGSGKSTCCQRLPSPWVVLCDDEALVLAHSPGRYRVHPLPTWNDLILREQDRTWNVSAYVPLHAIVFIRQSDVDAIDPMGPGQAATRICHSSEQACVRQTQSLGPDELRIWRKRMFINACDIAAAVPAFALQVSRSGTFWQCVERALDCMA